MKFLHEVAVAGNVNSAPAVDGQKELWVGPVPLKNRRRTDARTGTLSFSFSLPPLTPTTPGVTADDPSAVGGGLGATLTRAIGNRCQRVLPAHQGLF